MRDSSCRTTHPGPSAAALFDAVSLGPTWETRRHFGSLNGHGPSRHPGTPRRYCNRCRVSCKIQERRSSDVRATNTATLRHAEASTSSTAETSTKKSRLSGRQAFLAPAMGLRSDASRSRCHSTTPAPTATPTLLGIPARIAPQSPYTTAVVQASCCWRVAAFSKLAARRTVTAPVSREIARPRALTRPHDYLEHHSEWPDGRLADHAPPEAHLAQAVSQRLRSHLTDHNLSLGEAARLAGASRQALFNAVHGNT